MKATETLEITKQSELNTTLFMIRRAANEGSTSYTTAEIEKKTQSKLEELGYIISHDKPGVITIDWSQA